MNSSETKINSSLDLFLSLSHKIDWKKIPKTPFHSSIRYERPVDKINWNSLSINSNYSTSTTDINIG